MISLITYIRKNIETTYFGPSIVEICKNTKKIKILYKPCKSYYISKKLCSVKTSFVTQVKCKH